MDDLQIEKVVYIGFSGGIDSSCLIQYYLDLKYVVKCIHFDYGHLAFQAEKQATDIISRKMGVVVEHHILQPSIVHTNPKNQELLGRNALFILSILTIAQVKSGLISLGIHAGSPYYDCSLRFIDDMQSLLDGYFGGTVMFDAPFKNYLKRDIINWGQSKQIPFTLTYSCEKGSLPSCGVCPSCLERKQYGL